MAESSEKWLNDMQAVLQSINMPLDDRVHWRGVMKNQESEVRTPPSGDYTTSTPSNES
jgi:hypothetical protein